MLNGSNVRRVRGSVSSPIERRTPQCCGGLSLHRCRLPSVITMERYLSRVRPLKDAHCKLSRPGAKPSPNLDDRRGGGECCELPPLALRRASFLPSTGSHQPSNAGPRFSCCPKTVSVLYHEVEPCPECPRRWVPSDMETTTARPHVSLAWYWYRFVPSCKHAYTPVAAVAGRKAGAHRGRLPRATVRSSGC